MASIRVLGIAALIFLGVFALVIIMFSLASRFSKKRTASLRALARKMGFPFSAELESSLFEGLDHFYLFSRGQAPSFTNVMQGAIGDIKLSIFDYTYSVDVGTQMNVVEQTVMLFQSEKLMLPIFILYPENLLHKMGSLFGYQDIDFGSRLEFSKSYLLQGDDEKKIRGIFNDKVLGFFEEHEGLCTEGAGEQLIFYRGANLIPTEQMRAFIDDGLDLIKLFQ